MAQKVQRGGIVRRNDYGTLERISGSRTYIGSATLPNGKVITKRFRGCVPDEPKIIESWEKWQCRKTEDEEDIYEEEAEMANDKTAGTVIAITNKKHPCPFNDGECTPACPMFSEANQTCSLKLGMLGLWNIGSNLMKLKVDEEVEMVAMAVGELGSTVAKAVASMPAAAPEPVEDVEPEPEPEPEKPTDGIEEFFDGKSFISFVNLHGKNIFGQYKRFCKEGGFEPVGEKDLISEVEKRYPELKRVGVRGGSMFQAA